MIKVLFFGCPNLFSFYGRLFSTILFEPAYVRTINMTCAPSEDSDQPGHRPSLIRIFTVCMKNLGSLATHWVHSKDSDRTGMFRLIWVFTRCTWHFLGFVVWWLILFVFQIVICPCLRTSLSQVTIATSSVMTAGKSCCVIPGRKRYCC